MYSDNKLIRDVADVAARIMMGQTEIKEPQVISEELKGGQHKIDANKNNKIDAQDFKMLRSKKKVEEAAAKPDFLDLDKDGDKKESMKKASSQMKKEDIESIDEVKMADLPSTKVQGRSYGASKPEPHAVDMIKGPKEKELKDIEAEKKKKKFSEMVNLYQEKGIKSLSEMLVKEEPDNEQFTKELEDAKAKSEGKKKNTEIAKGAVQAVKQEEIEITDEMIFEVLENAGIDFESLNDEELQEVANEAYEILDELSKQSMAEGPNLNKALNRIKRNTMKKEEVESIEERMMTEPEKEKKEEIVKGMKKGLAGFKERYGDEAKSVMYATATKHAMKD